MLTPQYSLCAGAELPAASRLARQHPQRRASRCALLAGSDDEAFLAERFAEVFKAEGKDVPVTLLPGIGHIALTLDPAAVRAAVAAVQA